MNNQNSLESKLDAMDSKMDAKLDKISEDVSELKTGQARLEVQVSQNTLDLKEHMRRTDLNETRITKLETIGLVIKVLVVSGLLPLAFIVIKSIFNQ